MSNRIEIKNVVKIFDKDPKAALQLLKSGTSKEELFKKSGCVVAVDDVSLAVPQGSISVIMGLSGSGKSTLARCVNRILEPEAGTVLLDGEDITNCSDERLREVRRFRISMVFQNFGLFPNKSVIDNVSFGLKLRKTALKERYEKAGQVLEVVGLSAWASKYPNQLSGGMRQRVGLARALATEADVLIMDEAFSALDPLIRHEMQGELLRLQANLHKTVLFITHDFQEAVRIGTRIAILKDGALIRDDTPTNIVQDPRSDYVAAFAQNVDRSRLLDAQSILAKGDGDVFAVGADGRLAGLRGKAAAAAARDYSVVAPDAKLIEIAGIAQNGLPIAVVDGDGTYLGYVEERALLAGIAGDRNARGGGAAHA